MHDGVIFYRNERYLPEYLRIYARVGKSDTLPANTEWRLDDDHWTELHGYPILGRLLDGDPFLDEISETDLPIPFGIETLQH